MTTPDPVPNLRSPRLRRLLDEFDEARREAETLAGGLSNRQLWWRPEPGRWSVGECLDHLVRTDEAYLEVLNTAIEEGRREGRTGRGPFRRTLLGRWFARSLEPPPGLKIRAPAMIRPRRPGEPAAGGGNLSGTGGPPSPAEADTPPPDADAASPLARFVGLRDRLARCLEAAEGLDLGRVKVRSPFVPLLRVDLASAFHLVAAHERRHLWQARRVTERRGFPEE